MAKAVTILEQCHENVKFKTKEEKQEFIYGFFTDMISERSTDDKGKIDNELFIDGSRRWERLQGLSRLLRLRMEHFPRFFEKLLEKK